MKLSSNLPSGFKEPSTQDTEHAGNRHTQEASPPPDVQPATTQRRHQHSSRSWLKKLEKSGLPAHAFHESLGPSNHRNNLPEAVSIHRPTSKPLTEIGTAEKQDAESIRQSSARDALSTCKQEYSNIKWEFTEGPLDITNQGLSLQKLKLNKANIAEGSFGSVSIFENKNGDKLIGKISKKLLPAEQRGSAKDELVKELWAYLTIYKAAGPHPNLVNAHGIAQVPHGTDMQRALLMDFIPGPTGEKTFYALRKCWDTGKISSEQYWGAIQFIGRRLLNVTEHLGKAGVVHNDIKPANFLVNEQTGEPVLIDLGLWSKAGEKVRRGTRIFWSPETEFRLGVNEKSDVFTVAASLLEGIERGEITPNEGLLEKPAVQDAEGNMVREPGTYTKETAYTRFMNTVLEKDKDSRVNSEGARKLEFLDNSMLDDDAAKKVIQKAISLASKEEEKPQKEQWNQATPQIREPKNLDKHKRRLVKSFLQEPDLAGYAQLWEESKVNPKLRDYLNSNALDHLQDDLEEEVETIIEVALVFAAPWFNAVKGIAAVDIPTGVELDGTPRNPEHEKIVAYENAVIQAKKDLEPHANIEDLRKYAEEAEAFLRCAMALKKINNPEIPNQLEQMKERAAVARRMVEIFDTEPTPPGTCNIQERARELDPKWGLQLELKLKEIELKELELKELELKESQINS